MAKPRTASQRRAEARRRRDRTFVARNALALGASAVVVAVVVIAVLITSRGGDSDAVAPSTAAETGADFHSLVADPSRPGRLFAGGHTRVSVSDDGGRTWTRVRSLDDADAMGWAFLGDIVFVSGHPGLNRSTLGRVDFTRSNDGLPGTDLHALGAGRSVLYANAADAGFLASADRGLTWEARTQTGAPFFGRLVVDPDDDDHIFAADAQNGVAESRDGGRTWATVDTRLPAATWLTSSGRHLLIASGPAGAARSTDGGATWKALSVPAGVSLVEADPSDASHLYAGAHDGESVQIQVSRDGGATWKAA